MKRIIVIGASGYRATSSEVRLVSVSWHDLQKAKNLRDFDTVIINLLELTTEEERMSVRWNDFFNLLSIDTMIGIIAHGGRIIVLGDPRFRVSTSPDSGNSDKSKRPTLPFTSWTGIGFYWDDNSGDSIILHDVKGGIQKYLNHLQSWDYSLKLARIGEQIYFQSSLMLLFPKPIPAMECDIDVLAQNRYGHALAFTARLNVFHTSFGPIHFLPRTDLPTNETLLLVLRELCGISLDRPEPDWAEQHVVPEQVAVETRLQELQAKLAEVQQDIDEARQERASIRAPVKLLYEREFALEPVVRDVLRSLGADVEDPDEAKGHDLSKEDGWITMRIGDTEFEGVLEIKSTKSDTFDERGIRQAAEWRSRTIERTHRPCKAIFIGNSGVDKKPADRLDPFHANWRKNAQLQQVVALRAEDLFQVCIQDQLGQLNREAFWRAVFGTDGVLDVNPII